MEWLGSFTFVLPGDVEELRNAIDGLKRKSAKRKPRREEKRAKRVAKNDETARIYAAVAKRAMGVCEACDQPFADFDPPHMDHQLGRPHARQSVENCWLIHGNSCHHAKHAHRPSEMFWVEKVFNHAQRHGHWATADAADARMARIRSDALAITAKNPVLDLGEIKRAALSGKGEVGNG